MNYVISLGGSLINPKEPDTRFIKKFTTLIQKLAKKGDRFYIATGGGSVSRVYQRSLSKFNLDDRDIDWMGIAATRLNAEYLYVAFGRTTATTLTLDPKSRVRNPKPINIVAGGWEPGRSSDFVSVQLAKRYAVQTVINLSNIDFVYTADPKKNKHAKPKKELGWREYLKIVGTKWSPGANFPFDPTAAKFAQRNNLRVVIMNGAKLVNLQYFLKGKSFRGTIIE